MALPHHMHLELVPTHTHTYWNALIFAINNAWRRLTVEEANIGVVGQHGHMVLATVVVFVLMVILVIWCFKVH